jgi:hypothetical protein
MPGLVQSLKNQDDAFLRIVAELWGIDISTTKDKELAPSIAQSILTQCSHPGILDEFPDDVQQAIKDLMTNEGALPWSLFIRRHGLVREMGAARRDRQKPYLTPTSPAEFLWYRGILSRAFQETLSGPEEFACIPQDILGVIPGINKPDNTPLGRPALPDECRTQYLVNDSILDDTCTLLAGLRLAYSRDQLETLENEWMAVSPSLKEIPPSHYSFANLLVLLHATGVLDDNDIPAPESTRAFLEAPRSEALAQLFLSWRASHTFNDLRMIPSLVFEGDWQNDPLKSRHNVLAYLAAIPGKTWWSIPAFVNAIHQQNPDFQRRGGEYDAWYIREPSTNTSLRGYQHWDDIEGALIRFILCSPLHWMGLLDLAAANEESHILAFRISPWGRSLLSDQSPQGFKEENQPIYAYANGRLRIPSLAPRAVRYQISRFCRWEQKKSEEFLYRITPESLELATKQGLRIDQLQALLQRHASSVPPILKKALSRWETHGCEARLEQVAVLRVRDAELIHKLKKSKVARFLGDSLGPTSIIVKSGGWDKVQGFLAELGYLSKG